MTDSNDQTYSTDDLYHGAPATPLSSRAAEPLFPAAPVTHTVESWHGDPWSEPSASGPAAPPVTFVVAPEDATPSAATTPFVDGHAPVPHASRPSHSHKPKPAAHPALLERQTAFEQRLGVIMDLMQHGAWPQALDKLRTLRADFPGVAALEALIAEAELKAELMEMWAHKIKGRRLTVRQEWFLRRSLPFVLVLGLFLAIALFYQTFLAPSRQVLAQVRANQVQVQEAKGLAQTGDFQAAMALYQAVLARDPANQAAAQGLTDAQQQAGLAANYEIALQVMRKGNLARAANLLQGIQSTSPSYRDVDQQLNRLATLRQAEAAFLAAEEAFAQRRWLSAVQGYEQAAQISADYRSADVQAHLDEAYYHAAAQLLERWPQANAGPDQARSYLRRAQSAGIQREAATVLLAELDVYLRGEQAVRKNNLREAINVWRGLYDEQPDYLGGFLAEQLYRAYLTLATQATVSGDPELARQLYALAAQLRVRDAGEARNQLSFISSPTPTPTPLPTVPPAAPPVVYAPPPPTATPTPTPGMEFSGWIAFRSTRDGSEQVYVMRPDGSNQQRAPEELRGQLNALYERERWAPDGARVLVVQPAPGRSDASIYVQDGNGQQVALLSNDNGDEYDPVWAPNGQWVAYVNNHPGNDEIFLMRTDGSDKRRLTWNEWEWDKHPTWSPDSSQLAFFTNRTGPRQIWVMSYDGTSQRNISNSAFDDWDPVWLK